MALPQPHELTIRQAAAALRAGQISPVELLDPCLAGLGSTGDFTFNSPWTMAGVPVIGFPTRLASGLPLGLQLIGRRGDHVKFLAAARWCERIVDVRLVAPG